MKNRQYFFIVLTGASLALFAIFAKVHKVKSIPVDFDSVELDERMVQSGTG